VLAWAKQIGAAGEDHGYGVAGFADGSCLVMGSFKNTVVFGPGEAKETRLTADGETDIFIAKYNAGGSLAWAKRAGGASHDSGWDLVALADGSCWITGYFYDTAIFGPGEAHETPLNPGINGDIFIARYNPDGTLAWATRAYGKDFETGCGISALADGSCLVTGHFGGTVTFGLGEVHQTSITPAESTDVFIARYNDNGTLAWVTQAGGTSFDFSNDIAALSDGSCLIVGDFSGKAIFGPGEAKETSFTATGYVDTFIARYNYNGTLAWAKQVGGTSFNHGQNISAFSDNSSLVTGSFDGTATFGLGDNTTIALTSAGGIDIFIARYNPDGTLAWAKQAGGGGDDSGYGVSPLADGSFLATGDFGGQATFGPGEAAPIVLTSNGGSGIFIAQYNADGSPVWVKQAERTDYPSNGSISAFADGSCMVLGDFMDTATFGPGEVLETSLNSAGSYDIFLARYNPDGSLAPLP